MAALAFDQIARHGERPAQVALAITTYFEHGGLQRDCLGIARGLVRRGLDVDILVGRIRSPALDGVSMRALGARGRTNHARNQDFAQRLKRQIEARQYDVVVGFDPMPGLDVYFAGQPVYKAYAATRYGPLYRLSSRYRTRVALEAGVSAPGCDCTVLALTHSMIEEFRTHYGTPPGNLRLVKPTLGESFREARNRTSDRRSVRAECGAGSDAELCLFVGSRFRTKGLDRALRAFAAYHASGSRDAWLIIVGDDDDRHHRRIARRLGVDRWIRWLGGRDDVARLMTAADLLIHPARQEATGGVLIEAMAMGLPIICSGASGYAEFVAEADAGLVLSEPFSQSALDPALAEMLASPERRRWSANGIAYVKVAVPKGWREDAVDIIEALARSRLVANG